ELSGSFRIGAIIADHELNLAFKDSALLVHMLLAEQVALTDVTALDGVPSGHGDRGADPDRLLGHARPWRPENEYTEKHNDQAVQLVRAHDEPPFGCALMGGEQRGSPPP